MSADASRHKVLTIVDSLSAGGVQTHLLALAPGLNTTPYASDVFSLVRMRDIFSGQMRAAGSRVVFGAERPAAVPLVMARLAAMMRRGNYSLVHSYLPASYLIGTLVARALGHRKLITTVCARREQIHGHILSFLNYRRLQRQTQLYITPFPSDLVDLGIPREKIRFSLFAADYGAFRRIDRRAENPLVERYGLADAHPVVLTIGRFHPDKGHEHAIAAVRELRGRYPRIRLLILGEGFDEPRLKAIAAGDPAVTFCGVHRELAPFYSVADLYLNAAVNEGPNLSQLQAMAMGLPTLAFETGFTEYHLGGWDESVPRAPVGDSAALAREMAALLEDPARYARVREAQKAFCAQYDKDRVLRDYLAFYREVAPEIESACAGSSSS